MSTFGWCLTGHHKDCTREFNRAYWDATGKKMVVTDEVVRCECPKRGCKCYVKKSERTKSRARR